jgi:hypothetical protein
VPRLKKALRVPTPADRGPGRPWRPGTPSPAPIDPDLPSADIRIGYARCSTLGQELDSQLDALSKHGISRDKIFSEKISTRVRVRPKFEEALRTAREVKAHAPHCRVIFTVYEMKRLGRPRPGLRYLLIGDHDIQQICRALHAAPGRHYPPGAPGHQGDGPGPPEFPVDALVGHHGIGIHAGQSIGDAGCQALQHCWPVLRLCRGPGARGGGRAG